jgi:plasmid stabilization system protein ParE
MRIVLAEKARSDLFRIYRYIHERSPAAVVYLIFYTVDSDRIVVVRVIDARMDVDEEFQR